jgi:pyruvate ferredoxin oxidoreductase gamma subunit
LTAGGYLLINSTRSFEELGIGDFARNFDQRHLCCVPATEFALKHVGRPLPNAALLGGFAAISGQLRFESVANAIRDKFPGKVGSANVAAAQAAYDYTMAAINSGAVHA